MAEAMLGKLKVTAQGADSGATPLEIDQEVVPSLLLGDIVSHISHAQIQKTQKLCSVFGKNGLHSFTKLG
jgi:hypothetical protein